ASTRPSVVTRLSGKSPLCESCTMRANTRSGRGSTYCGTASEISHHTATSISARTSRCTTTGTRAARAAVSTGVAGIAAHRWEVDASWPHTLGLLPLPKGEGWGEGLWSLDLLADL